MNDVLPGFNEARADSPGRLGGGPLNDVRMDVASMRPGPIRPGDWRVRGRGSPPFRPASMRPGPIRPGDSGGRTRTAADIPGFNEARADSPGRFCEHWERELLAVTASMRPGPIRPGD